LERPLTASPRQKHFPEICKELGQVGVLIFLHHFFQIPDLIASHGASIKHLERDPFRAIGVMMACFS
jgi:hypothetical protein